jgi:hypothetical protein
MDSVKQPCLLCDAPVEVARADWEATEAPYALCDGCADLVDRGHIAWPMVRMLYVIRCQVASLLHKMETTERSIKGLHAAQKDMEQEVLRRPRAG